MYLIRGKTNDDADDGDGGVGVKCCCGGMKKRGRETFAVSVYEVEKALCLHTIGEMKRRRRKGDVCEVTRCRAFQIKL